jgi:ribonuclease T2
MARRVRAAAAVTSAVRGTRTAIRTLVLAVCLVTAILAPPRARAADDAGDFDSYTLALSWSPEHCQTHRKTSGSRECGMAYGFVVHGLWPDRDRGRSPESCSDALGPSADVVRAMLDVMPSEGLIRHEWQTHGTCSGLSPTRYFHQVRTAFERITIPKIYRTLRETQRTQSAEIKRAVLDANPDLRAGGVAVVCDDNRLREVHICLDKELAPQRCMPPAHDRCPGGTVEVPPRGPRGGDD